VGSGVLGDVSCCARGAIRARKALTSLAALAAVFYASDATAWVGQPPWLAQLIAIYTLEPPENRPRVIRRFGYKGRTGYCLSAADPADDGTLFLDVEGHAPESSFDGDPPTVCRGPAAWEAPAAREASAPAAVLADPRFSMSPFYAPFEFVVEFDGTIPGFAGTPMGNARYHVDSVTGTVVETFP
jgi:hypothetical protein